MNIKFSKNLIKLAENTRKPIYAVGGVVRNYLIDGSISDDVDLCAPVNFSEIRAEAEKLGFKIVAEYKRTKTVVFTDGVKRYEFTSWRKEEYIGGEHTPFYTQPTLDMKEDACRRDFKCNAVYYDIKGKEFIDPLGGMEDIKNKVLDTVIDGDKVFSSDGLRLMRLARFCGELNFVPTPETIKYAKKYKDNIKEISPERIFSELKLILSSDKKYPFSDKMGHYNGLKILDNIGVLDIIFPELTMGRGMEQRADFHKYDVLEHSLRTVMYADVSIRLPALLHDIGKPYCKIRFGKYHRHNIEGEPIAEKVLLRLKADKNTINWVKRLVYTHMYDLDCKTKEDKLRKFIVDNQDIMKDLLYLKQADFRAGLDEHAVAPGILKWLALIDKMKEDGTPFNLKQLEISGKDLMALGCKGKKIGITLNKLFYFAVLNPAFNKKKLLTCIAIKEISR